MAASLSSHDSFLPSILKTVSVSCTFSSAGMALFVVERLAFSAGLSGLDSVGFAVAEVFLGSAFSCDLGVSVGETILAGWLALFPVGFAGTGTFWMLVAFGLFFGKPFLMMICPLLCL